MLSIIPLHNTRTRKCVVYLFGLLLTKLINGNGGLGCLYELQLRFNPLRNQLYQTPSIVTIVVRGHPEGNPPIAIHKSIDRQQTNCDACIRAQSSSHKTRLILIRSHKHLNQLPRLPYCRHPVCVGLCCEPQLLNLLCTGGTLDSTLLVWQLPRAQGLRRESTIKVQ